MIEGYLGRDGVTVGGRLDIHVSTDAEFFRVDFHRVGATVELVGSTPWFPGGVAPVPPHRDGAPGHAAPDLDWGWPAHAFTVPAGWAPGAYVGLFVEQGAPPPAVTPLAGFGRAALALRSPAPAPASILYKLSTFTWHAYNRSDGPRDERASSLYDNPVYRPRGGDGPHGHTVSMRRPGRLADFAYWDAPFIAWLERAGYRVEFCTDLDLHQEPGLLTGYRLLLSVGHDEYWSAAMRDQVARFVRSGGNVAFLSANTCWWRTHVTDDGTALVCDTDHRVGDEYPHLPATDQWWTPAPDGVGAPENTLTGVSFRNGGMWPSEGGWPGDRPRTGFTVQHAEHWVYEGTGLRDGRSGGPADRLGAGLPLIGYECDGAAFRYDAHGVAHSTGVDGTPEGFLILGIAELSPIHEDFHDLRMGHWNCTSRESAVTGPRAATMGVHVDGGTVFTAATTDWPVIVGQGADAAVERVTRNVLDRLSR